MAFEDLDGDGSVTATLDGILSHTHMPNSELVSWVWTWSQNGNVIGTLNGETVTVDIAVGSYDLNLEVTDDANNVDDITVLLDILSGDGYSGCITYYYDFSSQSTGLTTMPDLSQSVPDVATVEEDLNFALSSNALTFGESGFSDSFAAQFICYFDITSENEGLYSFTIKSNDGSKFYINDNLFIDNNGIATDDAFKSSTDSIILGEGRHTIKVEYFDGTSSNSASHGLELYWTIPGDMNEVIIPTSEYKYALSQELSIIESIFPTEGTNNGGTTVTITGINFIWPIDTANGMSVVVVDEFGDMTTVSESDITWSDTDTTTITIIMPAHSNTLTDTKATVYVVTPAGYSNGAEYTYLSQAFDAPAWKTVQELTSGTGPTAIEIGPGMCFL